MSKRNRKHQVSYQQPLSKPTTSVDVVIPVYGEFDFLKTCLEGLPQALGDISYKLIIVDNASPDQRVATDFFKDLKYPINITVRRLQKNVGYPGAMNVGSKYGISPYILIHTPDVWYRPDAIKILLETMKSDPTYGIVCPKLLFPENCPHGPAGKIQHAGLDMDIHAEVVHTFIGWSPDHPKVNIRGEVFAATGASFLTRRSLWQQIGGFNTVYGKGTFEDVEFSIMCKARGFKVIYEPGAVATHYVGASKDQYALSENSQIFKMRNNQFFIWTDWRRL